MHLCSPPGSVPVPVPIPRRFVSKSESGPMFPLPVRLMMQFRSLAPMVQRMMSAMMSWMMYEEDSKIAPGAVLRDINEVWEHTQARGENTAAVQIMTK